MISAKSLGLRGRRFNVTTNITSPRALTTDLWIEVGEPTQVGLVPLPTVDAPLDILLLLGRRWHGRQGHGKALRYFDPEGADPARGGPKAAARGKGRVASRVQRLGCRQLAELLQRKNDDACDDDNADRREDSANPGIARYPFGLSHLFFRFFVRGSAVVTTLNFDRPVVLCRPRPVSGTRTQQLASLPHTLSLPTMRIDPSFRMDLWYSVSCGPDAANYDSQEGANPMTRFRRASASNPPSGDSRGSSRCHAERRRATANSKILTNISTRSLQSPVSASKRLRPTHRPLHHDEAIQARVHKKVSPISLRICACGAVKPC